MTRKQLYQQIAAFTSDWKSARRRADIFNEWCAVPLSQVENLTLSFGKYSDGHGNYYGENRDTLHFRYTDRTGYPYTYSILD